MIVEIAIPSPGESISEAVIAKWLVKDGDYVEKDQEVAEVESDKATLPLIASTSGVIKLLFTEGTTVHIGDIACTIDDSQKKKIDANKTTVQEINTIKQPITENKKAEPLQKSEIINESAYSSDHIKLTPLAQQLMNENNLSIDDILKGLKKITTKEVEMVLANKNPQINITNKLPISREIKREPMSQLRQKLSKRLVAAKNETAMLTTFNEVDMSQLISLRNKYQKQFFELHGIKLSFMSFFVKAATQALQLFPKINSQIDGNEIIFPEFKDIAFAVQTDKGLMVPVLRNTETMKIADIEMKISELAARARNFKLSIEEMTGGTFTITNGGVFGSMLSTPIINPPQSAILGMHNIIDRPVAIDGKVEIRPIMYVALSYDHRNIDGRDSVSFLVKVKELIESPYKILFEGEDPERILLGL